jgi:hypothetical protein
VTPEALNAIMHEQSLVTWLAWNHHRTNKDERIDFVRSPYLRQIFLDPTDEMIMCKCSQVAGTEYLTAFTYAELIQGRSVFYVFPNKSLVYRYVNNRFNASYNYTKYYQRLTKEMDVGQKTSSMAMVKLGKGTVIFVSAFTPVSFIEFPADTMIVDELDRCVLENINKGLSRLSASKHKKIKKISNPTIESYGIDEEYAKSNQYEWYLRCDCGKEFIPDFFAHVVRDIGEGNFLIRDTEYEAHQGHDIRMICDSCGRPINRYAEGRWIARYPERSCSGYRISKLYASTDSITELVDRFSDGLTNDNKLQDFYNFDLGLAFTAAGAKITELMLDQCIAPYSMPKGLAEGLCIAGIDVNYPDFNIVILRVTNEDKLRAVYIDTIRDYKSLKTLLREFKVRCGIIDAGPERRISAMLCARIPGMFRCDYTTGIVKDKIDLQLHRLTTNRTMALDNVKEAVLTKRIELPANARSIEGFYAQMTASTRVYDPKARHGEGDYRWLEGSKADHYMHSMGYALVAKKLLAMLANK